MAIDIIQAMRDEHLFGQFFKGRSWANWRVFLKALFGHNLTRKELEAYRKFTNRDHVPPNAKEAWLAVGRRGGKSRVAALLAVFLAAFRDYSKHLAPGEVATIMVIAVDRQQSRTIMRYVIGFLESIPMLEQMIERKTQEAIELSNRTVIEIHTCSFRSTRGYTIAACIADEIAFWRSEDSACPDAEVIAAIRPGMATIPNSLLLCISSPYARRGGTLERPSQVLRQRTRLSSGVASDNTANEPDRTRPCHRASPGTG